MSAYHISTSSTENSSSSSTSQEQIQPYPMQSGAINAAIGAVDKCCEFAAFCEKYVIPAGVCSPESLSGYICAEPNTIGFGFRWKTFYYSLDSAIEKQGYSIRGEGFHFSENSGMVFYERKIMKDSSEFEAAYSYMINTPITEIISTFQEVAEKNYTGLGLYNHSACCKCVRNVDGSRSFEFTV